MYSFIREDILSMSMATPLKNLPSNPQNANEDVSDMNDPMVQDVLNEFQEELMTSQNSNQPIQTPPPIQQIPQQYQQPINNIQYHQKPQIYRTEAKAFPYSYIDTNIVKKTLIIVIITLLVFSSTILSQIYEKLPYNIFEKIEPFDIYVKAILLFLILYSLFFFDYV